MIPAITSSRTGVSPSSRNSAFACRSRLGFSAPIVTHATSRYLGTIAIVSGLILTLFLFSSGAAEAGVSGLLLIGLLALVPASDLAIALVNREVTELLGPRALPRLALRDGVPADLRTLVVVPTLLIGHAQIAEQIERLEVHYLANPDGDLRFALLSDWTDAPQETMPGDDELLAATVDGIAQIEPAPWACARWERAIFHFPPAARAGMRASASGSAGNANVASCTN